MALVPDLDHHQNNPLFLGRNPLSTKLHEHLFMRGFRYPVRQIDRQLEKNKRSLAVVKTFYTAKEDSLDLKPLVLNEERHFFDIYMVIQ